MQPILTIRPELLSMTADQVRALSPYLIMLGGAVLGILASVLRIIPPKWPVFLISVVTLVLSALACLNGMKIPPTVLFNGMMVVDRYSLFFNIVFLGTCLLTVVSSLKYLDQESIQYPEYYLLLLFSVIGMMFMTAALDLVVLFICLEIMSLGVYSLVAFRRTDRRCNEAAMKYFVLGGVASAVLLYGAALLYGVTGSTNIREILAFTSGHAGANQTLFVLGAWLVIAGFLFKVASVPFHMWMPDVYEGAPLPVTGFMTTALKAAAFATFVRVFISMGYGKGELTLPEHAIHDVLWVCAVLTMIVGNVVALTQTNLKRMLAYSSIAHTGYLLVGMVAGGHSESGFTPVAVYLVTYAVMNLGAFLILTLMSSKGDGGMTLHDLSGASKKHPWMAFSMAVFLFSMAGMPPTAGFVAKYLLFSSAVQSGEIMLVVISVLCSAVSVYYYLRVLVFMYMREPASLELKGRVPLLSAVAVALMVAMTFQLGLMPTHLVEAAKRAVGSL